jgi:hypothetical protein
MQSISLLLEGGFLEWLHAKPLCALKGCPPSQIYLYRCAFSRWALKFLSSAGQKDLSSITLARRFACSSDLVSNPEKYAFMNRAVLWLVNGSNISGAEKDILCTISGWAGGGTFNNGKSHTKAKCSRFAGCQVGWCVYRLKMPSLLMQVWKGCGCGGVAIEIMGVEWPSPSFGMGAGGGT